MREERLKWEFTFLWTSCRTILRKKRGKKFMRKHYSLFNPIRLWTTMLMRRHMIVNGHQDNLLDKLIEEKMEKIIADNEANITDGQEYDVKELDDLIIWEKGQSIDPELEKVVKKMKSKISEFNLPNYEKVFKTMSVKDKMGYLTENNRYF